jgi:hypothetical protein
MNKPISAGDLVYVVRACDCNRERGVGRMFVVAKIEGAYNWHCKYCATIFTDGRLLAYGDAWFGDGYHPVAWLRRIPPLEELEGQRTEEKIHEPA